MAREAVDPMAAPWRSLVRVQSPEQPSCTGFVIAPRLVATAGHCVFNRHLGRFRPPDSIHVVVAYSRGGFADHAVARGYRTADGYDPRRKGGEGVDVAVVEFDRDLAAPVLALAGDGPVIGRAVALGGYNQGRREVIEADTDCRITGRVQDGARRVLHVHNCDGTFGTSGAPLLMRGEDGIWRVVGVQVAGRIGRRESYAVPSAVVAALAAR